MGQGREKKEKSLLAQNIVRRRKILGWTQMNLAEKAGLGLNTIKQLETDVSEGWVGTKEAIAKALGCDIEDLYQKPIETKWESMSQQKLAGIILDQAKEIDELKARLANYESVDAKPHMNRDELVETLKKEIEGLRANLDIMRDVKNHEKFRRIKQIDYARQAKQQGLISEAEKELDELQSGTTTPTSTKRK